MWLFKLLSLSKVNWLLGKTWGEKKKWLEKLPDWPSWLSINIWIGERQLAMSEEEEALWETSARHLRFRCFSLIFNTFHSRSAGLFQAGISDSRKWAPASKAGFWYHSPSRFVQLSPPRALKADKHHNGRHWQKWKQVVHHACVLTSPLTPSSYDSSTVTHGWCLPCRFLQRQLGANAAGYRSVSVCICPQVLKPGLQWGHFSMFDRGIKYLLSFFPLFSMSAGYRAKDANAMCTPRCANNWQELWVCPWWRTPILNANLEEEVK